MMQWRIDGLLRGERTLERRRELFGALDALAMAAERFCVHRKIRVLELGADHASRIVALLVHADGAVLRIVDDDDDERRIVLHGSREFLPVHQEAAVAGERDNGAIRILPFREHRRRHAISHRARGRRELGGKAVEAMMAMDPAGVVAGAVADDRVLGQAIAQPGHDLAVLERARQLARLSVQAR